MLLLLVCLAGAPGQTLPSCGFRNSRPCHPFDSEFYSDGTILGCDRGLKINTRNFWKTSDDICDNSFRDQLAKDSDWVRWAMEQQVTNIDRNEPINWYTHITAHNSYNNAADIYPFPNQYYSMTSLLNFGIRSLDLDIHYLFGELRVCHGGTGTLATGCSGADRAYGYAIREIADWLDANPGEVVIINLEDDAEDQTTTKTAPLEKYFGSKLWHISDSGKYIGGTDRYPSVAEMLAQGKQVIVVGDNQVGDDIFKGDVNSLSSRQASNFTSSNCTSSSTSVSVDPAGEPLYWPTLYEGRSLFESPGDQNNLLNEGDVRAAMNCGITSVDLDFIGALDQASIRFVRTSPDLRRESTIWSWAEGDDASGGNYALFNGAIGRWVSHKRDDGPWAFACAEPRTGDPRTWSDKKGDHWYITPTTGNWLDGDQACKDWGADTYSGTLLHGKATIHVTTVSALTSGYSLGDYAGRIHVTITLPLKPGQTNADTVTETNSAPVSLHEKLPTQIVLKFLRSSPTDSSLFFQADLVSNLNLEFRPTGIVELGPKTLRAVFDAAPANPASGSGRPVCRRQSGGGTCDRLLGMREGRPVHVDAALRRGRQRSREDQQPVPITQSTNLTGGKRCILDFC